jgi:perosamine synthetase
MPIIPIYNPTTKPYINSAIEALNSGWISNYGKFINLSSNILKSLLNINYCILMANGTLATEALFISLKFKHPNITDIYISDQLFISPYNCALRHFSSENIHILPISNSTLNLDYSDEVLNTIKPNSCLFIVHNVSGIVNVEEISRKRPDLIIIEDNCEGFLGEYEGKKTGSSKSTLCSAISFYANKNITSGEGGAFFTNDEDIYNHMLKVYSHGMTSTRYVHDIEAWNFRMTNVQAALLYDQLIDIDNIYNKKKILFEKYSQLISEYDTNNKIKFIEINKNCKSSYWMYTVIVNTNLTFREIENKMKEDEVEIRPMFYSVVYHKHLENVDISLLKLNSKDGSENKVVIMLPSSLDITELEQEKVIKSLVKVI